MRAASDAPPPPPYPFASTETQLRLGLASRFIGFFERQPPVVVLAAAAFAIAVLGLADGITGNELRFFVFYWPPIALVAWVTGRRWGLVAVAMSSAASLLALLPSLGPGDTVAVVAWNLAINAASFAALALGVAQFRVMSDRQRDTALTDYMTGVPNARAFLAAMATEIERARRAGASLSLAYLDVDDFKAVNDTRGHSAGNVLLRTIAGTIRSSLRASDMVARLGGDEFGILLPGSDPTEARLVIQRLLARLDEAVRTGGWTVTFSVGLVTCASLSCTHEELLQRADALMYEVKREGKNGLRILSQP